MNEAEKKLVEALRSGKYVQAVGQLKYSNSNSYCCLGVACEISGLGKFDKAWFYDGKETVDRVLPDSVREWLGWKSNNGMVGTLLISGQFSNYAISQLNDDGFTFNQIADMIEYGAIMRKGEL